MIKEIRTEESHHTYEQSDAGFLKAHHVLSELVALGVPYPCVTLYNDASGTLWLGQTPTEAQIERACDLVHSNRLTQHGDTVGISFCCGLVDHVPEEEIT